jgi:hypothetical protein
MSKFDEEKHIAVSPSLPHDVEDYGEIIVATRPKILTQLNHLLSRLGGEERGIERVLPHEKTDQVSSEENYSNL